jgi:hypothetical protein
MYKRSILRTENKLVETLSSQDEVRLDFPLTFVVVAVRQFAETRNPDFRTSG